MLSLLLIFFATITASLAAPQSSSPHSINDSAPVNDDLSDIPQINLTASATWVDRYTAWSYMFYTVPRLFPYDIRRHFIEAAIDKVNNVDIPRYGIDGRVPSGKWTAEQISLVGLGGVTKGGMTFDDVMEVLDALRRWNRDEASVDEWRDKSFTFVVRRIDETVFVKGRVVL